MRYRALPPSMEELDRLERAVQLGAMRRADMLLAVDPFLTAAEAAVLANTEAEEPTDE